MTLSEAIIHCEEVADRCVTDGNLKCEMEHRQLAEWLKELKLRRTEQRWIPCSERLPFAECGESDNVLATCGYRGVEDTNIRWIRTLYFDGDCWCCPTGGTYDQKVYAWMPLPEPWRGDSICK